MLGLHHYECSQLRAVRSTILMGLAAVWRTECQGKVTVSQLYTKVHNFRRERGQRMAAEIRPECLKVRLIEPWLRTPQGFWLKSLGLGDP